MMRTEEEQTTLRTFYKLACSNAVVRNAHSRQYVRDYLPRLRRVFDSERAREIEVTTEVLCGGWS